LDLTDSQVQKKWRPLRLWIVIGIGLVLTSAVVIMLVVFLRSADDYNRDMEAGLPAIKVVVTNGCGIDRLASEYAQSIDKLNIEVVALGDTQRPVFDKSIIVVRNGDMQDLKRLQDMTGIKRHTIALDRNYQAEFEIIIGRDFDDYITKP